MKFVFAVVFALCLFARATPAKAQDFNGPVEVIAVAVGTLGGVSTSVGAIVYALDGRAFDDSWIVASLFSSAICGAMTTALAVEGFSSGRGGADTGIGLLFYAAITVWPAYWTIRTALSEVDPGDKFEGEYLPDEPIDPFAADRMPPLPGTVFTFGGSF